MRPSNSLSNSDNELNGSRCLCLLLKAPVVVAPVVAGVLGAGLHAVLVHHLMQQGGGGLLDGTVKGTARQGSVKH